MSKSSVPPRSPKAAEDFVIEIDPSLIEEALAAVDRHRFEASEADLREDPQLTLDEVAGLEIDLEEPAPQPGPPDEEKRRLHFRVQEQAAKIERLERELARAVEARDALDRQMRDVRKSHSDLGTDFERFRARSRKDVEEAERRGEEKSLRPLVDVYDNVERAWLHAVHDPAQILGGLQMIVEQFKRLLIRLGFERIDADRGMVFDPACHEAVMHVRTDGQPPGTVVDEVQPGFRLRGRLFRPARVTVAAPVHGSLD